MVFSVEDGHEAEAARGGGRWLFDGTDFITSLATKTRQDNPVNTGKLMSNVHNTVHITHDSTSYYHNSQRL